MADARWISQVLGEEIMTHYMSWTTKDIIDVIWKRYIVNVNYGSAWSAKIKVLEEIYGKYDDSYTLGPEVCRQILLTNDGSIATCSGDEGDNTFMSSCIAFKASFQGFVNGCRPLIGLDGTFLKGKYGGAVLSATALDGNNGLFPLAVFICKSECTDTWKMFLEIIRDQLLMHAFKLPFISDRQKSIINAVAEVFPGHHHRFCFRHMYKNFKKSFKGDYLKALAWGTARAFTVHDHAKWMAEIQKEAPSAYEWLLRQDVGVWCRSYFDRIPKSEHITNNFSESYNNWIKDLRDKPITCFIEKLSVKIMRLIYERKMKAKKWEEKGLKLVPRVTKVIDQMCEQMNRYTVNASDERLFSVVSNFSKEQRFTVDITGKTCDCCIWDLTGIPCVHAVAVLETLKVEWLDYVDPFHHVKTYQKAYAGRIVPLLDSKSWNKPLYPILPPTLQRKPGRPKLNRTREEDEPDRPPKRRRICSTCKLPCHHKTTCAGGAVGSNKKVAATKKGVATTAKKEAAIKMTVTTSNKATPSQDARRRSPPPTNICSSMKKRNAAYSINPAPSSRDNAINIPRQRKEYQPPRVGPHVRLGLPTRIYINRC